MSLPAKTLLIRTDASVEMGTGHVMRCLALAEAGRGNGYHSIFALANKMPQLEHYLKAEGMEITHFPAEAGSTDDASETVSLARERSVQWIVLDGYHFGSQFQHAIKDEGFNLLVIDDTGNTHHFFADRVLNQNPYANANLYPNKESYTRLLLGTQYALLRQEFQRWSQWKRSNPEVATRVLISLGGSDFHNITLQIIEALELITDRKLEVVVVVGGSNPNYEELRSRISHMNLSLRLERDVTRMSELMAWADVALTGAGITCWELAFMGVPMVLYILAENQRKIAEALDGNGIAMNLGWYMDLSKDALSEALRKLVETRELRESMSQKGRALVDGLGSSRVLQTLEKKSTMPIRTN